MSNVLIVLSHPRRTSLTVQAAYEFAAQLSANGHLVEWVDLIAEGFDPVLREEDEPDWKRADKAYSSAVRAEMARIERNDATVMFFPVYWWSMPAVLKGWIDRVWNNGFAYGARKFPQRRVWMIGLAGSSRDVYTGRGYECAMRTQLDVGVLGYCEVQERRFELLFGAIKGASQSAGILHRARELGREF